MEFPCKNCKEEFCFPDTCLLLDEYQIYLKFILEKEEEKKKNDKAEPNCDVAVTG